MLIATILRDIILPVFILIGVGTLLDRFFRLDLPTLSKLNFYVFVPALPLKSLIVSDLDPGMLGGIALFCTANIVVLYVIGLLAFRPAALRPHATPLMLGTLFHNCGNYGIPLAVLAFGDRGAAVMAIVVVVQSVIQFTLGIWIVQHGRGSRWWALRGLLKVPVIWAVAAGLAGRFSGATVPGFLMQPIKYLSDGLIPVALLTMGVQLGRTRIAGNWLPVGALLAMRLVVAPAVAALLLVALAPWVAPALGPVLIVAAGLPVAVNVYVLALEYDLEPGLVSQTIFWSTLLSAATVTGLLWVLRS
jgi:predicted permease